MKNETSTLTGVFPVLPTIFDDNGAIDEVGQRAVLEYIINAGADGIVFPGLASEWDQLTSRERKHLVSLVGMWIDGRAAFIVGASAISPEEAAQYALQGADSGATAAMILTPPSLGSDLPAQTNFFQQISDQSGLPIMLQNAPVGIGVGLSVEHIAQIARDVDGVRLVKEETQPCGQRISALLESTGKSIDGIYGGAGGRYIIDEMLRGSVGTLPACEITEVHVAMVEAFQNGEIELARQLFERSLPLLNVQATFRWRLTKEVLKLRGLIQSDFVRAPGPALDFQDRFEIRALLERITDLTGIVTVTEKAPA